MTLEIDGVPTEAYQQAHARQVALSRQLLELTVQSRWLKHLQFALTKSVRGFGYKGSYLEAPEFVFMFGKFRMPVYFDSGELKNMYELANLFSDEKVTEEALQALIEEVLADELAKYDVTLKWRTFHGEVDSRILTVISPVTGDPYEDAGRN